MRCGIVLAVLGCAWVTACQSPPSPSTRTSGSSHRAIADAESSPGGPTAAGIGYVERILGASNAAERLPMLIAIHGLGDDPASFSGLFAGLGLRARLIAPRGTSAYYGGYSWFPVHLEDHDPERVQPGLEHAADALATMVRELMRTKPTCGAAVITGFSQGGMLSYALAARHPDVVGAAFPLSGMLPPSLYPGVDAGAWPRVQALHGEADRMVPVASARDTMAALLRAGMPATLQTYPAVGHTVSAAMRRDLAENLRAALAAQPCGP